MNENRHTPGPWLAQFCDVYEVKGMTRIADVLPRNKSDWIAEDHANARLIAAAPDLLAVCEQAVQFVAKYTADHESVIGQRMLNKMLAAIKQAKGEA